MNIYIVTLHSEICGEYRMPYYFTSEKRAYLYGEYKFRTSNIRYYKVEELIEAGQFFTLK